jgi:hypothetical protein
MVNRKKKKEEKTPQKLDMPIKPATTTEILKDKEGKPTGLETPKGVFLGLSRSDIREQVRSGGLGTTAPAITPEQKSEIAAERQIREQGLEVPAFEESLLQKQFASEGGFQELEGRTERVEEKIAEAGLAVPVKIADVITEGISLITGEEYQPGTAADLAETEFGKSLGFGIATLSGVALVAGMSGLVASTISTVTTSLASGLGVSKGALLGGGLVGGGILTGLNTNLVVDKILGREEASELQSSINTIGEMSTTIVGTYNAGGYGSSPARALSELNSLDEDLRIVEYKLQQAALLDPRVRQSGQYIDILADVQDQRRVIQEGRADILSRTPGFTPELIVYYSDLLKEINDRERQKLINKGVLRETL